MAAASTAANVIGKGVSDHTAQLYGHVHSLHEAAAAGAELSFTGEQTPLGGGRP
jgi:hypothetical protein